MRVSQVVLLLVLLWAVPAAAEEPVSLTMDDASKVALARSPRVTVALAKLRASQQDIQLREVPRRTTGRMVLIGPPITGAAFRSDFSLSPARMEIRQLLTDGGRVMARIREGRFLALGQAQQAVADWHQLDLEVRNAYLEVLRARAAEQASQETLEVARLQLSVAEARFNSGKAPRGDVLVAQVPVAEAELDAAHRRYGVEDAQEALNRLLGLPLKTPLQLQEPPMPADLGKTADECVRLALERRPELQSIRLQLAAAGQAVSAARKDDNATLGFMLGVGVKGNDKEVVSGATFAGGLELNWPFLDGGRTHHLTLQAQDNREVAAAQVADWEGRVEREVRQAYRDVELAETTRQLNNVRLERAREALRVSTAQYQAGFSPFYPLRESQAEAARSHIAQTSSGYDYIQARSRLGWAMGEAPPAELKVPK